MKIENRTKYLNELLKYDIYPKKIRNPYYIVAPRYSRTSAGIKVLHFLCHALNCLGERSYLIIDPYHPSMYSVHPDLLTPLLTKKIITSHYDRGLTPIVVYPETVSGNPYKAPFIVRYLLNYPGLLGGNNVFDPSEFCISYSKKLGDSIKNNRLVLFIPVSDPSIFYLGKEKTRKGTCFYASKYRDYHNAKPFDITNDSFEITRDLPDSLTQENIAEIFRTSELFYCYENSSLIVESILCGCPVVMIPNEHLKELLISEEIGWDGIAWGTDPVEINRAKKTVLKGRENYFKLFSEFENNLLIFIEKSQNEVVKIKYENPIKFNSIENIFQDNIIISPFLAYQMFKFTVKHSGYKYAILRAIRRIFKKGIKIDLDRTGI